MTDEIRQVEFEAFRAWVRAAVSDSTLIADKDVQPIGPQLAEEVIRHARKDRVLASFVENVWTEVGRCAACHSPDQNQKQVKEHGEQVSWIARRLHSLGCDEKCVAVEWFGSLSELLRGDVPGELWTAAGGVV